MRRGVACIAGCRITGVARAECARRPIEITPRMDVFRRRAVGRTITAVDRVGKRVVLRLDSDEAIIFEPRMTGLVLLSDPPAPGFAGGTEVATSKATRRTPRAEPGAAGTFTGAPTKAHLRFRLTLERPKRELLFWDRRGLGLVRLVSANEFDKRYGSDVLGPDALAVSRKQLQERLAKSRRAIKVALLDQRSVAGVGNLYASEILHLAGVHPQRRCNCIKPEGWQRIHAAMLEVLHKAIRYEGSTLSDGTYRNALNQNGGYQSHHRVYDKASETCPTCRKHPIQRIVQAQRSTFFCGHCQPKGAGRRMSRREK